MMKSGCFACDGWDEGHTCHQERAEKAEARIKRLEAFIDIVAGKVSGDACPFCTPSNNWGHTVSCRFNTIRERALDSEGAER